MQDFDFIIVGAGSAGCVLANKLTECGNYSVCLLEAGPKDTHWSIQLPIGVIQLMKDAKRNWLYDSAAEPTQNNRKIFNPRGKTLGGSSSINAMLYVRGQPEDYDHWAELGNEGWGWDEVLPYFKATQNQERGESELHGIGGGLNVTESRSKIKPHADFIEAAVNAGFKANEDFNGEEQEGVGYYQLTQKDGLRWSTAKGFLTPILDRPNLTVITGALVEKTLIENKKATGVRFSLHGVRREISAKREVLLSAGAFNSPKLLMLSGVGPKDELEKHGIDVVHALEGVGKNLQDHPDAMIVQKHKRLDLVALRPIAVWQVVKDALIFFRKRAGILTTAVAESGGFIKSSEEALRPDLQLHFIPGCMDDHGRNLLMLMNYGISVHVCILRPKSRGEVTLHDSKPETPPKIQANMLDHPDDIAGMIKGIRLCRKIFAQSPLRETVKSEVFPGVNAQSDDDLIEFLRAKSNNIYHPVGTCKMGHDDMAVVNPQLQVHGIENLRVVDCSIMPTLISGNTNAPAVMIAAKAADMILAAQ